jgi:penicillin-binding protein-related factor A (putative recombinase)
MKGVQVANRGKTFEQELRRSMTAVGLLVHRISDAVSWNGCQMVGAPTPGDFYAFGNSDGLSASLVEAKAVNGKSLPFNRLEQHQFESLMLFDSFEEKTHGYVAINFYDADDIRHFNKCFMVPIGLWADEMSGDRKSLPMSRCEEDDEVMECPRVAGSMYDMAGWALKL